MAFQCSYVATVAVVLYNDGDDLFDSHIRNQHGQMVVNGQSVMLEFSQLSDLEKYIQTIYLLQRNQRHAYLQIQYIAIIVGGDSSEILRDFHHKKKLNQQMKRHRDKISQKKKSDLSLPMTVSKSNSVIKSVQGSYNQGHERFGTTAGMQCTSISLFPLCWSVIRKVSIYQNHDLEYIICTGDKMYKDLSVSRLLEC